VGGDYTTCNAMLRDENEWNAGLDLDLAYHMKISSSLYLTAEGSYYQIADVYNRFALTALITYTF